jgi:DNA-binding LytR/AlgR family response regulator
MKLINCVIIDDNEVDRIMVEEYVQQAGNLKLIGSFSNALEASELLKQKKVQLLFVDVEMPMINGIDFIKTLEDPPLCIFITSYPEYAVEAFGIHAFDYLLKPLKTERFEQALKRVEELMDIRSKALEYDMQMENDTLLIKEGNSISRVNMNDIIFLEALTNYTKIVTTDRKYITLMNLKGFLEELPQDKFIRVHRSYAVAKNKISRLRNGELQLGIYKIPVGKTYRLQINKIFSDNIA